MAFPEPDIVSAERVITVLLGKLTLISKLVHDILEHSRIAAATHSHPEFLFEFDDYEQTNEQFDGNLSKNDYEQFSFLYKDVCIEEINQLFMLGIDFDNACEGSDFSNADDITIDILEKAQMILSKHRIPYPDIHLLSGFSVNQKNGWGDFLDSSYLSIII